MKHLILSAAMCWVGSAYAEPISSAYTDIDAAKTCKVVDKAKEGDGDWAKLVCDGYKSYKVYLDQGDIRESIAYGARPAKDVWESFDAPNSVGPKIEWRLDKGAPFATIHRWSVTGSDGPSSQYLVVEKVGRRGGPDGCAVAIIRATGNAKANEQARKIADEKARAFKCGDAPISVGQIAPFSRQETGN